MVAQWTGEANFNSQGDRERAVALILDFVENRDRVMPRADANYTTDPSGVERVSQLLIGDPGDPTGPGFRFSIEMPDGDVDAFGDRWAEISGFAMNAQGGSAGISG